MHAEKWRKRYSKMKSHPQSALHQISVKKVLTISWTYDENYHATQDGKVSSFVEENGKESEEEIHEEEHKSLQSGNMRE